MSYILDALKKAERDRRRAHVPSLGTMHAAPAERRNVWPWVIGGLVGLNVVALVAVFVLRSGTPAAPLTAPPSAVTTAPTPARVTAPAPAGTAAPAAPVVPTPAPLATPAAPLAPTAPAAPAAASAVTTPTGAAPATPRDAGTTSQREARPPASRVAPSEPEALKLEILVFSENTAERAAYINGQRYVEGQRVQGRMVVERIMRDGVILAGDGKRVVLKQE